MKMRHCVRTLPAVMSCTCVVLLAACGSARATDERLRSVPNVSAPRAQADRSGFPLEVLVRPDLQRLVDAGLDRQTDPLLSALGDPDPVIRATAAHALASVQDPAARPRLIALLADADAAARRNAAFALGQLGESNDASALIDVLGREADPAVRFTLHEALGRSGSAAHLALLIEPGTAVGGDASGLSLALYHFARRGVTDARAALTLLTLLSASDESTRMRAALALAAARNSARWGVAADHLRPALSAMEAHRREAAPLLRILAVQGHESDAPPLPGWLADRAHWTVRTAAAAVLGAETTGAPAPGGLEALRRALNDPSPHVAGVAAASLVALRARSTDNRAAPDAGLWAEWIRTHPDRPAVAAALLPGLVGTPHESLVIAWATGRLSTDAPRALAFPALALIATPEADSLLVTGLLGARRDAYVAAAALARRLEHVPADAPLRSSLIALLDRRLDAWGPYAPGSDVRGVLQLLQALTQGAPMEARELIATAAQHPHAEIRAAAARAGADTAHHAITPRRLVNWSLLRSVGVRPCVQLATARGSFVVELHPEAAPLAVSAFIEWAVAGAYDGLTFHRVEPDFILQSGDFDNPRGYGGPERGLRSEFSQLRFAPGVLGIASYGKDTEGSQFFITHNHAPSLDGRYSAIGRVIAGLDVADGVALGDTLIAVSLVRRRADAASDETSTACTPEHT